MRLGWPIPSPADKGTTVTVRQPATLGDVLADDGLLRRLDAASERPYPLQAADLKSLRVELIADVRLWTERMRVLQTHLPPVGNRAVVVYDGLHDLGAGKGLVARVAEAGGGHWSREQITVWPYPEDCWKASQNRNKEQTEASQVFWLPYQATVAVDFNPEKMQPTTGGPTRTQLKTRTAQLTGEYSTAIKSYLAVQLAEYPQRMPIPQKIVDAMLKQAKIQNILPEQVPRQFQVPQEVWFMHFRATEDAKFWTALAQYELGEYHAAVDSFENYQKRYGVQGLWSRQAAVWRAIAQAEDKRLAEAVYSMTRALQTSPDDDPQRAGYELLVTRWRAAHHAAQPKDAGK
jgi:hypothetical protein